MKSGPSISVLMTVFNAGPYLDAAIGSIASQVFRDWEFVIVDDASTDGSAEVAEEWSRRDSRIIVIRNDQNKGQTPCLNQGLRAARGTWIARQDADDLSHPLRLTRQYERLLLDPEIVLLGTAGRIIDENNQLCGLLDVPVSAGVISRVATFLNPFLHTAVMFRREVVLSEFGGYDERFRIAQDYDLWLRLLQQRRTANIPARLVCYRHLQSSLSKAGSGRAFAEASEIADRALAAWPGRETLSAPMRQALQSFREGRMSPSDRAHFWQAFQVLSRDLAPEERREWRRYEALLHLRAAGGLSGHTSLVLSEMMAAYRTSPWAAFSWMRERWV